MCKYGIIRLDPMNWVRGCRKPFSSGAKASLNSDLVLRTDVSPIDVGVPLADTIRFIRKARGINDEMIFEHPDHRFFGGVFL